MRGFGLGFPCRRPNTFGRSCADIGVIPTKYPIGVYCHRPIDNSGGQVLMAKRQNGEESAIKEPKTPPYARRNAILKGYLWPVVDQAYRSPSHMGATVDDGVPRNADRRAN